MNSPKDPKPEDANAAARRGSALEHTFLGVAPTAPEAGSAGSASAGSGAAAAGGSAIIAAPMISVSGDRAQQRAPAAPVAAPAPAALPALARTSLQGGWQSSAMPRPTHPEPTASHGTPGAWPAPGPAHTPAPVPAAPRPTPQPPRPQAQRQVITPQPAPRPAAPGAGLHHTALASDYLQAARAAALGAAPAQQPPQGGSPHFSPQQTFAPLTQPPVDIPVNLAESFVARPPTPPPPTQGPPATAALSEARPLPIHVPVPAPQIFAHDHEQAHGPRSIGTQASVAPPPTDPAASLLSPGAALPGRAPAAAAPMGAAASPVRNFAPPNAMAGTMLDRTPSIPGGALQHAASPAPTVPAHSAHSGLSTRFEQVPSARGSLQATGFGLQIPIDQSGTDWGGGGRTGTEPTGLRSKQKPPSQLRMILLATLALAAVGFATFGKQLFPVQSSSPTDGIEPAVVRRAAREPDQTTLTNLPSAPAAPGTAAANAAPAPAAEPSPAPAAAPAAAPALPQPASTAAAEPVDPAQTKAAAEAGVAAEAAATPESRLAAQAGRHVIAARFAEALPLYRELQRSYPQNTAYAAMARVLEQKTGAGKPSTARP